MTKVLGGAGGLGVDRPGLGLVYEKDCGLAGRNPVPTGHEWLVAVEMGLQRQFPDGVREQDLHLMNDYGCHPTGKAVAKACARLGIPQAFTSYNNPKGNVDTERLMRTLKGELIWLREWSSHQELQQALGQWIEHFNEGYHHSTLDYKTPSQFEDEYQSSHQTQFVAA